MFDTPYPVTRYHRTMAPPDSVTDILARIAAMRSELESLGVTRIGIFGSRTTGQARPGSDLDVLVELEPGRDSSTWSR